MSKNVRTEAVDHLFDAILSLENKEECYKFFEDVCTVNELLAFSQRYEVAKMLREQRTYLDIAEKTGASTATISRVNRSLNYGCDGYDMVFARTNVKPWKKRKSGKEKRRVEIKLKRHLIFTQNYANDKEKHRFENWCFFDLQEIAFL